MILEKGVNGLNGGSGRKGSRWSRTRVREKSNSSRGGIYGGSSLKEDAVELKSPRVWSRARRTFTCFCIVLSVGIVVMCLTSIGMLLGSTKTLMSSLDIPFQDSEIDSEHFLQNGGKSEDTDASVDTEVDSTSEHPDLEVDDMAGMDHFVEFDTEQILKDREVSHMATTNTANSDNELGPHSHGEEMEGTYCNVEVISGPEETAMCAGSLGRGSIFYSVGFSSDLGLEIAAISRHGAQVVVIDSRIDDESVMRHISLHANGEALDPDHFLFIPAELDYGSRNALTDIQKVFGHRKINFLKIRCRSYDCTEGLRLWLTRVEPYQILLTANNVFEMDVLRMRLLQFDYHIMWTANENYATLAVKQ